MATWPILTIDLDNPVLFSFMASGFFCSLEDADDIVLAGDVPGIVVAHRFRLVAFQSDGARLRTVTQGHEPR